jgi:hypothetical protein
METHDALQHGLIFSGGGGEKAKLYIYVRGSVVAKALCYKPEDRGFDTRRGEFLNVPNPCDRTRPWGLLSL